MPGIKSHMIISDTRVANNCHTSQPLPLMEVKAGERRCPWIRGAHFHEIAKGTGLQNQLSNLRNDYF